MSEKCYKCFKSKKTCLCDQITPIDTGVKFVILMHPHEAYKEKTGTGRLTNLSLIKSEIIIDNTFDKNLRTQELLTDDTYFPMLLYPGEDAVYAENFKFDKKTCGKTLLIFLIDASWVMARKMMSRSPSLQKIQKISFRGEYRSEFKIKKQPKDYCLSTIESTYYLIKELQKSQSIANTINPKGLMDIFETMVQIQVDSKNSNGGIKYNNGKVY